MTLLTELADQAVRPRAFLAPLGVWLVMAVVAVLNGGFRETLLIDRLGEYRAHVLSTALLVFAILLVAGLFFRWTATAYTQVELLLMGVLWTVLTVGFEFLVGYLEDTPVSETLAQHDVLAGQVWIAVPVTLLLAPLLFGWYLEW